ncbi:MAG: hypothetical protein J2P22_05185, partial [Nocardioides sp.]|nr:hypothetical protein [Nocardioides sp.]
MLRPSSLPHARARVTALVLGLLAALTTIGLGAVLSPATAAPRDPTQPLVPKIRSITPGYVPERGPIVVRGTVTNATDQVWTAINVHGFIGSVPITTPADLAEATQTPLAFDVGNRITLPGTFDHIDSLPPGETRSFVVRLPRSALPVSAPGVYWFGVHVLGDNGHGGSRNAVGRDRTFIPLVPSPTNASPPPEATALMLPVRAAVVRGTDGAIEDPAAWTQSLQTGALHELVNLGQAAHGHPLTWLVDPAVVDTVRALAHGNPPRTLGNPPRTGQGESPSASPSASATDSSAAAGGTTPSSATEQVARRWLRQMHRLLASGTGEVLGLPYGDVAVESATTYDDALLAHAFHRTGDMLRPWGLPLSSAVAPPEGRTTGDAVAGLPSNTDVLLHDSGVRGTAPTVAEVNDRRLVLTASEAAKGGPGPVDPRSPLALRQRILSEAALRYLGDQQPLVVELPLDPHHRVGRSFFTGLDVPWLRLTTLNGATAVSAMSLNASRLREPQDPQLGRHVYTIANQMLEKGRTLQTVLPG